MRGTTFPLLSPGSRCGFTLSEVLMALLVFALAATTILALLSRSISTVDQVLMVDEATQLCGALEGYLEENGWEGAVLYGYQVRQGADEVRPEVSPVDGVPADWLGRLYQVSLTETALSTMMQYTAEFRPIPDVGVSAATLGVDPVYTYTFAVRVP